MICSYSVSRVFKFHCGHWRNFVRLFLLPGFIGMQIYNALHYFIGCCEENRFNSIIFVLMDDLIKIVNSLASDMMDEVIAIRRAIHAYPEIAFDEFKTSALIRQKLTAWGIHFQAGIATTGVVALIEGYNPEGPVIALRADMDALPIEEKNDAEYASTRPGYMHACGHDAHTAMVLGAGKIIHSLREYFSGKVMLIFQPSEEMYPGGAKVMLEEGLFGRIKPDILFAQHVLPELNAGTMGLRAGQYMASTDEFYIRVKGKGGHGATPHLNIDPIVIAAEIIMALQTLVSRNANPAMPTVISVGKMIADGMPNVIPDTVDMEGIIRTFDEIWRKELHQLVKETAKGIAKTSGGTSEVNIAHGYPALYNNPEITERVKNYAYTFWGKPNVAELPQRMTADDMAYFLKEVPGTYYRLGTGNPEKGIISNLHSSTFDIDEDTLLPGMAFLAYITLSELEREKK